MRIGITCNLKNEFPVSRTAAFPDDAAEEFDSPETIEAIEEVLQKAGHEVHVLGGDIHVMEQIRRIGIEFVLNLAEGYEGPSREAQIPALLELMHVPYSGSDPLALSVTLDKSLAKHIAASLSIPTPEFWTVYAQDEIQNIPDRFPLFVKLLWEGSSKGIRRSSRVETRAELERETARLFRDYPKTPVLAERYIEGRELTIGVLGNALPEVLGVMEISFQDPSKKDFCYSLEVKREWRNLVAYECPAPINSKIEESAKKAALDLFKALRLRDVARFDFRLDPTGTLYFLEVNPLPGLSPESGDLVIMAKKIGWSYEKLILRILDAAFSRYDIVSSHQE